MNHKPVVFGVAAAVVAAGAFFTGQSVLAEQGCCTPQRLGQAEPVEARQEKGAQRATIVINGGYTPAKVAVEAGREAGRPVELTFVRNEKAGCGDVVQFPSLGIKRSLKTGEKTVIAFTPKKAETIPFTCGMSMYRGEVVAK
jgi:plastocyanin domain-containing protein